MVIQNNGSVSILTVKIKDHNWKGKKRTQHNEKKCKGGLKFCSRSQ